MFDKKNKYKVLVVDDDSDILEVIEKKLRKDNYKVMAVATGKDAIKQAKEFLPDIILMDIVLPDLDGSDAVKALRGFEETANIPIIFLSGIVTSDSDATTQAEVKVGDELFPAMGKPFSYSKLIEQINAILK